MCLLQGFYNLADEAVAEELKDEPSVTKKKIWEKMGSELEIAGIPKHKISQKIQSTIESRLRDKLGHTAKINNAYYYRIMKRNEWQDPEFDHSSKDDAHLGEPKNTSYEGLNKDGVEAIRDVKNLCNILERSLKTLKNKKGEPLELADALGKKETSNFFSELKVISMLVRTSVDDKTKVPTNTHHIFKACLRLETGLLAASRAFMKIRMDSMAKFQNFITKKQANKFRTGDEPNMLSIYKPTSRDHAIYAGYYGMQCTCSSWRVRETTPNGLTKNCLCLDCDRKFAAKTLSQCNRCQQPLYDDILAKIKKTGICPDCKNNIILPSSFTS